MAIGFKHGTSGGQALGLCVVSGTSKPAAPKQNTIWVNSGTSVASWTISPAEPDGASGRFWVQVNLTGTVALDVSSGKNSIIIQPVAVYEYTSEGWAARSAEVYLDGEWKGLEDLTGYYFKDGNQCTSITGGWTTEGWGNYGTADIGTNIVISTSGGVAAAVGTAKKIDLTGVNTIWYDSPNGTNGAYNGGYLCVKNTKDTPSSPHRSVAIKTAGVGYLDVSALSGEYYVYVCAFGTSSSYLDIRAIWAE